ncbi:DUF6950 family protein [Ensifer aridi]|uniref:DUF6950 family protein n=1 Tax=Ensifer aridi TaxID=1708715 RepID=UPI000A0F8D6D|nr:hypothetical protein [Ensifer aridi]
MNIAEYISDEMKKPFEPGKTDCANTADRWFMMRRGISAMEHFGRQVHNADDMEQWLSEPRAIIKGVKAVAVANNVPVTRDPKPGDIGIVIVDNRACIALYNGDAWWSRDEDGFIVTDDTYRFIAWSVG